MARLPPRRFHRIALVALQHQRPPGGQVQRIAEPLIGGSQGQPGQRILARIGSRNHLPFIDPGPERGRPADLHPRLTDPSPRQTFGDVMLIKGRHRRMTHPKLRALPAFPLDRSGRAAEQRPLHPVLRPIRPGQVGGQIPPFDAKRGVRAMICRKLQHRRAVGQGEPLDRRPHVRKPLRRGSACQPQPQPQENRLTVHWQTPSVNPPAAAAKA